MSVVYGIARLLTLGLLVWIVLSYIVMFGRLAFDHPIRRIYEAIDGVVEPVLRPIRAVVPPLRVGAGALDLSPVVLIVLIQVVPVVLDWFF
ncbi:MAG: YggT family protein [Acidimicrobiia bacterium]|nr:YggT family protein [Acidimicrobiia bacterium]